MLERRLASVGSCGSEPSYLTLLTYTSCVNAALDTAAASFKQQMLGVRSRQAVHDLIQRRRVLGLATEDRRTLVPVFQFSEAGRPYEAIPLILRVFGEAEATGWTVGSWITTPNPELGGETPIGWIRAGCNLEDVLDAARAAAAPLRW